MNRNNSHTLLTMRRKDQRARGLPTDGDILPPLPYLASSISEEEEEDVDNNQSLRYDDLGSRDDYWQSLNSTYDTGFDQQSRKAMELDAFLQRYETMLRHQYAEDEATASHLVPLLKRIEKLAPNPSNKNEEYSKDPSSGEIDALREISYADLRSVVKQLDQGSCDEDLVQTDKQLMLVLRTISEGLEPVECQEKENRASDQMITWGEIMQCYKLCVSSVQSLEKIPCPKETRDRVRDRSLSLLSLFQAGKRQIETPKPNIVVADKNASTLTTEDFDNRTTGQPRTARSRIHWLKILVCWLFLLLLAFGVYIQAIHIIPNGLSAGDNNHAQVVASVPLSALSASQELKAANSSGPALHLSARDTFSRSLLRSRCFDAYRDPVFVRRALYGSHRNVYNVALMAAANQSIDFGTGQQFRVSSGEDFASTDKIDSRSSGSSLFVATVLSTAVGGSTAVFLASNPMLLSAAIGPAMIPAATFGITAFVTAVFSHGISNPKGWLRKLLSWLSKQ